MSHWYSATVGGRRFSSTWSLYVYECCSGISRSSMRISLSPEDSVLNYACSRWRLDWQDTNNRMDLCQGENIKPQCHSLTGWLTDRRVLLTCLGLCLSVNVSSWLPVFTCACVPVCLVDCLPVCLPVCMFLIALACLLDWWLFITWLSFWFLTHDVTKTEEKPVIGESPTQMEHIYL